MFILKKGHQPGVYVPLRAPFLVFSSKFINPLTSLGQSSKVSDLVTIYVHIFPCINLCCSMACKMHLNKCFLHVLKLNFAKEHSFVAASNLIVNLTYELRREKTGFLHICENKDADQLCGNREADQRLCFCYIESKISLLSKYEISSL